MVGCLNNSSVLFTFLVNVAILSRDPFLTRLCQSIRAKDGKFKLSETSAGAVSWLEKLPPVLFPLSLLSRRDPLLMNSVAVAHFFDSRGGSF